MKKITLLTALFLFCASILNAQNNFFNVFKCKNNNQENTMLFFYNPDCTYCLRLLNDIDSNLKFQEELHLKYAITLIDVTTVEGQNLAAKYEVNSVPFIICKDSDNSEVKRIKGYNSLNKIALFLDLKSTIVPTSKYELSICGNGILESGEACDDGNVTNGDGCESNCTITQIIPICGNGILESGEACDDGNVTDGDGCESNCTITQIIPICGNGILESGEACDDGNVTDGDGCESNCTITQIIPICGNGILESGEACDDGNVTDDDGCESNCTISILSFDNFNESSKNIILYPMPFTTHFSVVFGSNSETDFIISIYNGSGQLVKHQSHSNTNFGKLTINELDNLKSGIYFLKIESNNSSYYEIRKIVKM